MSNDEIERVKSCKYLGMYLDENLKYHDHISYVKSKLRQYRGMSFRVKKFIDRQSARKIYYSMVYSTVTYCISVWGGIFCCTQRGEELHDLHKAILKNHFYEVNNDVCIFKATSILKLIDVYKMYVSIKMFKLLQLGAYPTLLNDLYLRTNDHVFGTRNRGNLLLPFPRVENIRLNYKYMFSLCMEWNTWKY